MAATPARRIVMSDDLWSRFGQAVETHDPETNRSSVIRSFVRWYVGEEGAYLPDRPENRKKKRT